RPRRTGFLTCPMRPNGDCPSGSASRRTGWKTCPTGRRFFTSPLMQLAKVHRPDGATAFGAVRDGRIHFFHWPGMLGELLAAPDPAALAADLLKLSRTSELLNRLTLLAPVCRQEVWAAGVTYKRSKIAREEESVGAAQFYDKVYTADRPELFLKASPWRV